MTAIPTLALFNLILLFSTSEAFPSERRPLLAVTMKRIEQTRFESTSFLPRLKNILKNPNVPSCLGDHIDKLLNIAEYLDLNEATILEFERTYVEPGYRSDSFGPITVKTSLGTLEPVPGFQKRAVDWRRMIADYKSVDGKGVSADTLTLYLDFMTLLDYTELSLEDPEIAAGFEPGRDANLHLRELKTLLTVCVEDANCRAIEWNEEIVQFLANSPILASNVTKMLSVADLNQRRSAFDRFKQYYSYWLNEDEGKWRNEDARLIGNELIVPMDSGFLEPVEKELRESIEGVWNVFGMKLTIEWRKRVDESLSPFLFVFLNKAARASVNPITRTVKIPDRVRVKTFAHEFGHVLGLPDEYYESFRLDTCTYLDDWDAENLMSSSKTGKVLPRHWEILKRIYK